MGGAQAGCLGSHVKRFGFIPSAVGSISARALSKGAAQCHRRFGKVTPEAGLDVLTWKNIQDRCLKKKGRLPSETRRAISVTKKHANKTHVIGGLKGHPCN